jgi:uncharacterized protein (TIGR02001 family)
MKTKFVTTTVCAAALMAATLPALAEDEADGPISFSGSVTLTSNYVFRGISQTQNDPAIQGSLDLSHEEGFYLGVWASNIDFDDGAEDANLEVDFYAGFIHEFETVSIDIGVLYYAYPDAFDDYNYWEIYLKPSIEIPVGEQALTLKGGIYYSPEFFFDTGDATYLTAGVAFAVNEDLSIDANVGVQSVDETVPDDYTDWNVGVTLSKFGFSFDLRYTDTDMDDAECFSFTASVNDVCDAQVVFSIKRVL